MILNCQIFYLMNWSPCIDRGTDQGTPILDFEGDPLYDHPGVPDNPTIWDMGADEFTDVMVLDLSIIYSLEYARPGYLTWWKIGLRNEGVSVVNIDRIRLDADGPVSASIPLWTGTINLESGEAEDLWVDLRVPATAPLGQYTLTTVAEYLGSDLAFESFECEVVE